VFIIRSMPSRINIWRLLHNSSLIRTFMSGTAYLFIQFLVESVLLIFLVFCVVLFVLFVFVMCLVYPMLPVSLDRLYLIAPCFFFFVLCLVYPMLPVSLHRLFLIAPCFVCLRPVSCVPNVASVSRSSMLDCSLFCLSSSCVLCTQCCQCLYIVYTWLPLVLFVFVLCLVYPMLPVSLDRLYLIAPCFVCIRPVSCVPNVASVSRSSILDCPMFCLSSSCVLCTQCCQCLYIVYTWLPLVLFVFVLSLVYPMLPVSLDRLFLIAPCFVCLRPVYCVPNVASVSRSSILDCSLFCLSSSCLLCTQCCQCL
jgi:hypothetical protein